jgi:hypothetical protein
MTVLTWVGYSSRPVKGVRILDDLDRAIGHITTISSQSFTLNKTIMIFFPSPSASRVRLECVIISGAKTRRKAAKDGLTSVNPT